MCVRKRAPSRSHPRATTPRAHGYLPIICAHFSHPSCPFNTTADDDVLLQDFLIPRPNRNAGLSKVNANIGNTVIASFQYNTTGFPYLENIQEACGVIQNSTLPSGYALNMSHPWSPTYVFYNGENDANYTSECWMAAYAL
jgi:hypothetical protein